MAGATLNRSGIVLGGELVPLLAGSVHYWQVDRRDWRACLTAVRELGFRLVDLYVPWAVHERKAGQFDFGQHDPQCDVTAFLRMAQECGLWAIVRPGPRINGDLTHYGIPERVIWDRHCQARSPKNNPVIVPMLPQMFPEPSYASEAYRDEVRRYFHELGKTLAPLRYPDGPIVLLQVDNAGGRFRRDGAYEQDYHPDAIRQYRQFLRRRYRSISALREVYGPLSDPKQIALSPAVEEGEGVLQTAVAEPEEELRFANAEPPRRFDAESLAELAPHLDWAEFQEEMLVAAIGSYVDALRGAGMDGIPISHNLPVAQETTPLNAARLLSAVDMVGIDYDGRATAEHRAEIARRTSEVALRADGLDHPAFACEMAAGFPPHRAPREESDSAFTVLSALAYGLRGFNVCMAVERDRWLGAPIDGHGRRRPFAQFWLQLCDALQRVSFHRLRRRVPVRLLMPRNERRIARVMHAFGPAPGALVEVLRQGARESCLEDDLGAGYPLAIEAETFTRAFEQALEARGVPFAFIDGEDPKRSMAGARWVVCATSGGLSADLVKGLREAHAEGVRLTVGPRPVHFDGLMRPRAEPAWAGLEPELIEGSDPARADAAVAAAMVSLKLPRYACDPDGVQATMHEDEAGRAQVLFVIQPEPADAMARVTVGEDAVWTDVFEGHETRSHDGVLETRMRARSVRMFARADQVAV